jgi:hypothetical protein
MRQLVQVFQFTTHTQKPQKNLIFCGGKKTKMKKILILFFHFPDLCTAVPFKSKEAWTAVEIHQ